MTLAPTTAFALDAVGVADTPRGGIASLLDDAARRAPDGPAVVGPNGQVVCSMASLAQHAARLAAGLAEHGLQPGDKVGILVRDPNRALPIVAAVIWAGGVAVAPPRTRGLRAALRALAELGTELIVADGPLLVAALALGTRPRHLLRAGALREGAPAAPIARQDSDAALVSWTTGTTGRPKPIIRSHAVLAAQHRALAALRALPPGAIDLVGLPTLALHDLAMGVGIVFAPARSSGAELRRIIERARPSAAAGFPALFARLVNGAAPGELDGLASIHVGGAPVQRELVERLQAIAPQARISVVYGMTEAEPITAIGAREFVTLMHDRVPGAGIPVGRPWPGIEVDLVPLAGRDVGRIRLRGARVAVDPGPDESGWLDTGDAGRIDGAGRIWLLGRAANAAGTLYPAEIEEPAADLPGVAAAALVSLDRDRSPVTVLAVERTAAFPPREALAAVCQLVRDAHWAVDDVLLVRRIPRDARSGKVDYTRLAGVLRGS